MSIPSEGFLPDYEELKQSYPEEMEFVEETLNIYTDNTDPEELFSNPETPEIISDARDSTFEELVNEYGQSPVFDLVDYGLLDHKLDGIELTAGGEHYLQILEDVNEETGISETEAKYLWTPEAEVENSFSRYQDDLETIRNVFEGRDTPEKHIRWSELPETPEDFPENPDWFEVRSSKETTGPDWITVLD